MLWVLFCASFYSTSALKPASLQQNSKQFLLSQLTHGAQVISVHEISPKIDTNTLKVTHVFNTKDDV